MNNNVIIYLINIFPSYKSLTNDIILKIVFLSILRPQVRCIQGFNEGHELEYIKGKIRRDGKRCSKNS